MKSYIESKKKKNFNNSAKNVFNLNLTTINSKKHNIRYLNDASSYLNYNTISNTKEKPIIKKFSKPKKIISLNKNVKFKTTRNKTPDNHNKIKLDYSNIDNINDNLTDLINRINFNSLNEYYKLETNIFLKKIQRLNLKFYYTTDVLLSEKIIKYPYDELFLILFKEISLYIEEIERLNKQILSKGKNDINNSKKMQKAETNKNNISINKDIKVLQKKVNLLQKENEKYRNEIDKLNKKLNSYNSNINKLNKNFNINNNTSDYGVKSLGNSTLDSWNSPRKTFNVGNSGKLNIKKENKNELNDIIKNGIKQCNDEINNLSKIEELLMDKVKKKYTYSKKK